MTSIVKKTNSRHPSFFHNLWNDDFFNNFFEDRELPAINVVESKKDFKIEIAAPGMDKKDFKIKVDKDVLEISAEKEIKLEEEDKESKFLRREFGYTSFSKTFNLPAHADAEKISATEKNGVLTIRIPKKAHTELNKVKEIEIK